jgi:uncharacterized protein YndB with AHSA1/START domain
MAGKTFSFEVKRTSSAPPSILFRLETDGASWSTWAKPLVMSSRWAREGSPEPAGVGAIREIGAWPVLVREETLEYEPDTRHVYTLVGRTPVKDYRAEATFTPTADGGTDLTWTGSFTEKVPGTGRVMLGILRGAVTLFANRITKVAESQAP